LQLILFHVCECVSHLGFRPAHGFPNNWKIDGDYPPAGGQRNSFLAEFTALTQRRGWRGEPQSWFDHPFKSVFFCSSRGDEAPIKLRVHG
jgi:hypothetical protein